MSCDIPSRQEFNRMREGGWYPPRHNAHHPPHDKDDKDACPRIANNQSVEIMRQEFGILREEIQQRDKSLTEEERQKKYDKFLEHRRHKKCHHFNM